jgi:pimeloyl-ACP methyl ester carboxylesterase
MDFQPGVNESGHVDIGDARLFCETRGSGKPVVLVHGGLLGRRVWDSVLAPFSRRYRTYRFDQRGYGDSDRPKGAFAYWKDILELANHWSLPKASYVAFGEGGAAAIDLALVAPDRVESLVLISPYLHGYDYSPAFQTKLQHLADAYLATGASAVADALTHDSQYMPPARFVDERKRLRDLVLENAHVLAFNWMQVRPLDPLANGRLGELAIPTLIISGERDYVDNLNVADRLKAGIFGARHSVVSDAGHVLPVEAPAAIAERVSGFLNSLPSS